jgi:hypothetical protein
MQVTFTLRIGQPGFAELNINVGYATELDGARDLIDCIKSPTSFAIKVLPGNPLIAKQADG